MCQNSNNTSTTEPVENTANSVLYLHAAATSALASATWTTHVVVGVLGMLGNGFVAIVLFHSPAVRRRLTNIYIINQCLIDSVASVLLVLTTVFQYDGFSPISPGLAGEIYCRVWIYRVSQEHIQSNSFLCQSPRGVHSPRSHDAGLPNLPLPLPSPFPLFTFTSLLL